jgi:hypothetical protein
MIKYMSNESLGSIIITDGLLEHLEEMFPDRLPTVLVGESEISKLVGQQQVIRWLKDKQEEIREETLKGDKASVRVT